MHFFRTLTPAMTQLAFILFAILIFVAPFGFLHRAQSEEPSKNDPVTKLNQAYTKFGFKLYEKMVANSPGADPNIFISPSSIAWCLSMVLNGAQGKTGSEIAQTLEWQGDLAELNQAYAEWSTRAPVKDPKVELDVANSLWVRRGLGILPAFLDTNRRYFGAEVQELNFNDPGSTDVINSWVKTKTREKIDKVLDSIDPQAALFLINAIYFKGMWTEKFDAEQTKDEGFTTAAANEIRVPMMRRNGKYRYFGTPDFQAVSLPYGDKRLSMYVFLPAKESSLAKFQSNLNADNWSKWMTGFQDAELQIGLPRFQVEYETTLNDALKSLGMRTAFDPQNADFGAMLRTTANAYISSVKHKAFAEVNEEGTEAAAATSTEIRVVSMQRPIEMIVNRPFFFAIRDNGTGAVLFIGSINNPRS